MAITPATIGKSIFTGSVSGQPILINATSSSGGQVTIHQCQTSATAAAGGDEIWMWAGNNGSASAKLTWTIGSTATLANSQVAQVPANSGLQLIIPGLLFASTAAAGLLTAISTSTGTTGVFVMGFANLITSS